MVELGWTVETGSVAAAEVAMASGGAVMVVVSAKTLVLVATAGTSAVTKVSRVMAVAIVMASIPLVANVPIVATVVAFSESV